MSKSFFLLKSLLLMTIISLIPSSLSAQEYTPMYLGEGPPLSLSTYGGAGFNNSDQIAGTRDVQGHKHAILVTPDSITDLHNLLPAGLYTDSKANSISGSSVSLSGVVAGLAKNATTQFDEVFVYNRLKGIRSLGNPFGMLTRPEDALLYTTGVNNRGAVIVNNYTRTPTYWTVSATCVGAGCLDTTIRNGNTFYHAINNKGRILGDIAGKYMVIDGNGLRYLTTRIGDNEYFPYGLNDNGSMLGSRTNQRNTSDSEAVAMLFPRPAGDSWDIPQATRIDIPRLYPPYHLNLLAMNNNDEIVGGSVSTPQGYVQTAVIWDRVRGTRDLNTLIPQGTGIKLYSAVAINDQGDILAYDGTGSDEAHGIHYAHYYLLKKNMGGGASSLEPGAVS